MSDFSIFSPYANLPGDPCNWAYEPPVLSAPVGWQQPNFPEDVLLVQSIVNLIIDHGYLESYAAERLQENGTWDETLDAALGEIEVSFLSGLASPFGQRIIDNGTPLFQFLVHLAAGNADLTRRYSPVLYQLARVMLPAQAAARNLSRYLPYILQALAFNGIADTQMVLMALATIRAEAEAAAPISEGVSRFNSSIAARQHHPGTHLFDLYETPKKQKDLGNTLALDGATFKGRGFVQLTGRSNYTRYGNTFGWPLVDKPDAANEAWVAAMLLSRFLKNHESQIRDALRRGDLRAARRYVNGGSNGLDRFTLAMQDGRAFLLRHLVGETLTRLQATQALDGKR
jgi:putative chitinase